MAAPTQVPPRSSHADTLCVSAAASGIGQFSFVALPPHAGSSTMNRETALSEYAANDSMLIALLLKRLRGQLEAIVAIGVSEPPRRRRVRTRAARGGDEAQPPKRVRRPRCGRGGSRAARRHDVEDPRRDRRGVSSARCRPRACRGIGLEQGGDRAAPIRPRDLEARDLRPVLGGREVLVSLDVRRVVPGSARAARACRCPGSRARGTEAA